MLSRDAIARLIPHSGSMCLLEQVLEHDDESIVCRAVSHRDPAHPLREGDILPAVCGVEYAAQAMAVHGALMVRGAQKPGALAAVRDLAMEVERLDDIADALIVSAHKLGGDSTRLLYRFTIRAGTRELMRGRAAVVLNPSSLLPLSSDTRERRDST